MEFGDARLPRDAFGRLLVVPGEHDDAPEPEASQIPKHRRDVRLYRVLDAYYAHKLAVDRQIEGREALRLPRNALPFLFLDQHALVFHHEML